MNPSPIDINKLCHKANLNPKDIKNIKELADVLFMELEDLLNGKQPEINLSGLTDSDLEQVLKFNQMCLNYIKMKRLKNK